MPAPNRKLTKPFSIQGIPGTFVDKSIGWLRWQVYQQPIAVKLDALCKKYHVQPPRWFIAERLDGFIRCGIGREPYNCLTDITSSDFKWHISISHVPSIPWGQEFLRNPSWDEMKHAKFTFCPRVEMALEIPKIDSEWLDDFPTCLHLWEV